MATKEEIKKSIIVTYEMWKKLKQEALDRDLSIRDIILDLMEKEGLI